MIEAEDVVEVLEAVAVVVVVEPAPMLLLLDSPETMTSTAMIVGSASLSLVIDVPPLAETVVAMKSFSKTILITSRRLSQPSKRETSS